MRKAIPLGVVDYETLKNQNYFFIDKSMMIYDFLYQKVLSLLLLDLEGLEKQSICQ